MIVSVRRFIREDIPKKIEWINNPENNKFLHYDIPIDAENTEKWYENNYGRVDRYDAVIVADGFPCGTVGLISIDKKNSKAEFYIAMGEDSLKGKGISTQACKLIMHYGFIELGLNRIYLFTETANIPAQRLFEKVGFIKEGCIREDVLSHGHFADRYVYGICKKDYYKLYCSMDY